MTVMSLWIGAMLISSCSSKLLKYGKEAQLKKIEEFEKKVDIVIPVDPNEIEHAVVSPDSHEVVETPTATPTPESSAPADQVKVDPKVAKAEAAAKAKAEALAKKEAAAKMKAAEKAAKAAALEAARLAKIDGKIVSSRRQPEIESAVGFEGRRPIKDPFRVGEKVVHEVHYFSISAGSMAIEVKPFAQVNGRKSYHFQIGIKTSRWYSGIYSVDDKVSVLMDYDTLVPSVFQLHVRESGQLREARMLFDKDKATFWERKVTEKNGEEERKLDWEILEYSQNVFSAAYYMRVFDWPVGTENAFRVADDGENLIFRGKAIRKEKISIPAGKFDTVVVQPQIELKGKYKPVGDIFIWLSDDDRKLILKIQSKIKIGTLVSEAIEIRR